MNTVEQIMFEYELFCEAEEWLEHIQETCSDLRISLEGTEYFLRRSAAVAICYYNPYWALQRIAQTFYSCEGSFDKLLQASRYEHKAGSLVLERNLAHCLKQRALR